MNLKTETNEINKSDIPYCINCIYSELVDFGDNTYDLQCWKNRPFYEIVDEYDRCDDYEKD